MKNTAEKNLLIWMLDASTFINFSVVQEVRLLARCRERLFFPEYVYRYELTGQKSHQDTKEQAEAAVERGDVEVLQLTLDDLERIVSLGAPRKFGLGEIACAVVAERKSGGVLCDDRPATLWLKANTQVFLWEATEDVLLDAAWRLFLDEYDLETIQEKLERSKYCCRCNLRNEHLMRRLSGSSQNGE